MVTCIECSKELQHPTESGKCLDCCKKSIQQLFKEHPEVKQAYKESIEEMKKPENMKKMIDDTVKFVNAVQRLKDYNGCRNCKHQPEPMRSCDWLRTQTQVHTICPRWELRGKKYDNKNL